MKPRDQGGVVDARLNVYGVEGLKVAGTQYRIPLPALTLGLPRHVHLLGKRWKRASHFFAQHDGQLRDC